MNLKTILRLILYSQTVLLVGVLLAIAGLLFWSREGHFLVLELALGGGGIILFFSRSIMISRALKTSKYPGLLYAILEKLGLTQKLNITLTEEMRDEIHRPPYPTSQLLQDNNLVTDIGYALSKPYLMWLVVASLVVVQVYLFTKFNFRQRPFVFIFLPVLTVSQIYFWKKSEARRTDQPQVRFTEKGLWLHSGGTLSWKNITGWRYETGSGKYSPGQMLISWQDADGATRDTPISLGGLNADRIDFMILLTHFKGKYDKNY